MPSRRPYSAREARPGPPSPAMIDRFTKGSELLGQSDKSKGSMSVRRAPIYRDFLLIQLAVLVFLADQFSKYLVREFLVFYESFPAQGFLRITHTFNTGSIFGLFPRPEHTPDPGVFHRGRSSDTPVSKPAVPTGLLRLSLGLQLGGAFGNLVDRVRLGAVTDWVDIGPWPVFNVADASIVTGLIILAWLFVMSERSTAGGPPKPTATATARSATATCARSRAAAGAAPPAGVREKVLVLPQSSPGDSLP